MNVSSDELVLLKKAQQDMAWLSANYSALVGKYNDQFVAIHDQQVLASSASQDELNQRCVALGFNPSLIIIKYITNAAMILSSG